MTRRLVPRNDNPPPQFSYRLFFSNGSWSEALAKVPDRDQAQETPLPLKRKLSGQQTGGTLLFFHAPSRATRRKSHIHCLISKLPKRNHICE